MAFDLQLSNPMLDPSVIAHRIAPVRFARAVKGVSDKDAPDLDDHGFTIPTRFCAATGPVCGIMQGETVRIKLIRDRLEPTAQLFATTDDDTIAALDFPSPGAPISPNDVPPGHKGDCVYVRGTGTGIADQETRLTIRFGAVDGPVVAELAIRVYQPLIIRVQAHQVSINGTGPAATLATIRSLFKRVDAIYAQAGVRFVVGRNYMTEAVAGFARAGTVTLTGVADQRNAELQTVLRQHFVRRRLNAYFFSHYFDTTNGLTDQVLGIAFSRDDATGNPPNPATGFPGCQAGITVRDTGDPIEAAHTIAHEIGHSLKLQHYALGNGSTGSVNDQREDIWAHRCLMYNIVGLGPSGPAGNKYQSTPARIQVGYGMLASGVPSTGQLLTTKRRAGIQQSDQINVLRRAIRDGSFMPV